MVYTQFDDNALVKKCYNRLSQSLQLARLFSNAGFPWAKLNPMRIFYH